MRLPKLLAIIGMVMLILGAITTFSPATVERYESKSYVLASETVEVSPWFGYRTFLTYFFLNPEDVRNLKVQGYVKGVEGGPFNFEITDAKTYVKAERVLEKSFEFPVEPEELRDGLHLKIEPATKALLGPSSRVSIYAKATWEEKTYAHVLGGLIVGGALGFFGIAMLVAALVTYIIRKPKVEVKSEKSARKFIIIHYF